MGRRVQEVVEPLTGYMAGVPAATHRWMADDDEAVAADVGPLLVVLAVCLLILAIIL